MRTGYFRIEPPANPPTPELHQAHANLALVEALQHTIAGNVTSGRALNLSELLQNRGAVAYVIGDKQCAALRNIIFSPNNLEIAEKLRAAANALEIQPA